MNKLAKAAESPKAAMKATTDRMFLLLIIILLWRIAPENGRVFLLKNIFLNSQTKLV